MSKRRSYKEQMEAAKKPKPEGYVFGRPTLYRHEFCEMLVKHMAEGLSFKSFAAVINTTDSTLENWVYDYPDFFAAKQLGRQYELLVWEKIVRQCASTGKGNATAIIWATKNKFPEYYKERNEAQQINVQANVNNIQLENWSEQSDARLKELQQKEQQLLKLKTIDAKQ